MGLMHKPRRSSLRLCPEPLKNESMYDQNTRRVSFSRTIFVCGAEMEVSKLPLSCVSDESVEVTALDAGDAGQLSMSMGVEQVDYRHTETLGSRLTEVTRPDESQSLLLDSSTFLSSAGPCPEISVPCVSKSISHDASMEMSVCSDPTPKRSEQVRSSASQPPQFEVEMDISIDKVELTFEKQHPSFSLPASKSNNSDVNMSWTSKTLISPIPRQEAETSAIDMAIVHVPCATDCLPVKTQPEVISAAPDGPENGKLIEPITRLSAGSDEEADSSKSPTGKEKGSPGMANVALLTPSLPIEGGELIPRSSIRRLLCSLPPLRSDRTALQLGNGKICHTLLGIRERSGRRQQLVNRLDLQVDDRLMSQSLATTPLRQVIPKDWIQATVLRRGDSLSTYDVTRRYEPDYLLPSVSRLQSHVTQISQIPVHDKLDLYVGLNLLSLQQFFDRNASVLVKENTLESSSFAEFEQIIRNNVDDSVTKKELLDRWHATQVSNQCQLNLLTEMYEQRQSEVLLQHLPSYPVVQQLEKMSKKDRLDFVAQAHERFHQCIRLTTQEYHEFKVANSEVIVAEKQSIIDAIHQLENQLDAKLAALESELDVEKNAAKELREVSHQLKDKTSRLKSILDEAAELEIEIRDTLLAEQQLDKTVSEHVAQIVRDTKVRPDVISVAPGATELYVPLTGFAEQTHASQNKDVRHFSAEAISNKFSPADVVCLSYGSHLYAIRTLFGLVWIVVTCRPVYTKNAAHREISEFVFKPEHLIVQSVEVKQPSLDNTPVDCDAVHTLAENVISLCSSREGRAQFCSRLIGMTLGKAIWFVEYTMTPFFLLAGDLRAIFLNGHYVHLECTPPLDATFTTPGQRSLLHRSTLSVSVSVDGCENKPGSVFDRGTTEVLIPAGPFTVTVKLCHHDAFTVLLVRIVLPSLEPNGTQVPETSIRVLLGQLSPDELDRVNDLCRVYPGHIHRAIQAVEQLLSASSHT
ncbi:hypothetical protein D915_003206 [Fasciola hepatica]|uniref:Spc7 kinetochore protein domain-containing protein n=1 Tax=Fasciola hepatica TaxID=6192 RepID=A0A4E0S2H2_FASHE|nr:hypothetical protein D915_003206 [Fasciola hepatica]